VFLFPCGGQTKKEKLAFFFALNLSFSFFVTHTLIRGLWSVHIYTFIYIHFINSVVGGVSWGGDGGGSCNNL